MTTDSTAPPTGNTQAEESVTVKPSTAMPARGGNTAKCRLTSFAAANGINLKQHQTVTPASLVPVQPETPEVIDDNAVPEARTGAPEGDGEHLPTQPTSAVAETGSAGGGAPRPNSAPAIAEPALDTGAQPVIGHGDGTVSEGRGSGRQHHEEPQQQQQQRTGGDASPVTGAPGNEAESEAGGATGEAHVTTAVNGARKLPATFDPSTCRTLYVGNLHAFINETVLQDVFSTLAPVTEVKVIKDRQTGLSAGYGFVKLVDHVNAEMAMNSLNGAVLYGQEIRVNWAFQSNHRDDTSGQSHIFVGDLSNEVTDNVLYSAFADVAECTDARVMWDHSTGRSKGYGFVSFKTVEDAEQSIQKMNGEILGGRRIRCGWAQHKNETNGHVDASDIDRTDPTNTNIYIGNISSEVTDADLLRHFGAFGHLVELKQHRKGGYGFVRYQTHEEAVGAIYAMNGKTLGGKTLKCSWGRNTGSGNIQQGMSGAMGPSGNISNGNMLLGLAGMQHMAPLINAQALALAPGLLGGQHMLMNQHHLGLGAMVNPAMQALMAAGQPMPHAPNMTIGMQQPMMMQHSQGMGAQQMLINNQSATVAMSHGGNMYYGMYYK